VLGVDAQTYSQLLVLSSAHVFGGHPVTGFVMQILVILLPHVLAAHLDTHRLLVSCCANVPSGHVLTHMSPAVSPKIPSLIGQISTQDLVEFYLNLKVPAQFMTHWPPSRIELSA
jgi:hypothetical protein